MMYRLIMCIAVIGLVREAAAGPAPSYPQNYPVYDAGTAPSYPASDPADAVAHTAPSYPASDPADAVARTAPSYPASDPAKAVAAAPVYAPPRWAPDAALSFFKAPIAPPPPAWSWTGFYVGAHVGAALGSADFADRFGSSIFGDKVTTPGFLAGGQIGYNWQVPNSNWVLGVEADASWLASDGTNTCLAFSGSFVSANCRSRPDGTGTLTGRVGYAYGPFGRTLIYAKGGAALLHNQIDIATNGTPNFIGLAPLTTSSSFTKVGWTVGAGVEHAITPAWSVKLEYDYLGLGGDTVATPPGLVQPVPSVPVYFLTPAGTTRVTQNFQEVKLGLNYRFGMDPMVRWDSAPSVVPLKTTDMVLPSGWEVETGARYWYSNGRFQKDLGSTTDPALANTLNSRLTYNTTANSGEIFGRVETPVNIFVKGNIGIGSLFGGHMNDEDWAIPPGAVGPDSVPYSNTLSDPVKGHIDYATVDFGYDFLRGADYKLGAFLGYNYYRENKSAYGCTQIANPLSDCVPAIPSWVLGITENDAWTSFRIGVNGQIMIADRFKLEADVAYLPSTELNGTDNHVLRSLISPESGAGTGVQIESILSYLITDQFSVGVGGRYWAMWATNNASTEFGGLPCPCQTLPAKAERYGAFVQASYNFGAWRRRSSSGPAEWSQF